MASAQPCAPGFIVDCDAGVDDAQALYTLLRAHSTRAIRLLAVVCTAGNAPLASVLGNVCAVLDSYGGVEDVPVYAGAARPLLRSATPSSEWHGADGLGNTGLGAAASRRFLHGGEHGADATLRIARQEAAAGRGVTLLVTGPCTTLALALALGDDGSGGTRARSLPACVARLVIMGGAVRLEGNVTPAAEYNFHEDAHAAAMVLGTVWPDATLVSWEATKAHGLPPQAVRAWLGTPSRRSRWLARISQFLLSATATADPASFARDGFLIPDPLAAVVALRPDAIAASRTRGVAVETGGSPLTHGATAVDWDGRCVAAWPPCVRIVDSINTAIVLEVLVDSVARDSEEEEEKSAQMLDSCTVSGADKTHSSSATSRESDHSPLPSPHGAASSSLSTWVPSVESALAIIDSVISADPGCRGIAAIRPLQPNGLRRAAAALLASQGVIVLTGFPCRLSDDPPTETDGPPGAVAVARAALRLGKRTALATDECNAAGVRAAALAGGLCLLAERSCASGEEGAPPCCEMLTFPPRARWGQRDADALASAIHRYDHAVAVERAGAASDGSYYTMRARCMDALVAPLDALLVSGTAAGGGCASSAPFMRTSTAVGDGGNEAGMGSQASLVHAHIPNGATIACVTPADAVLVAGVSNWGGYAIAAAVELLTLEAWVHGGSAQPPPPRLLPSAPIERSISAAMAAAGVRDGVSGSLDGSVDGMPLDFHLRVLERIAGAVDEVRTVVGAWGPGAL